MTTKYLLASGRNAHYEKIYYVGPCKIGRSDYKRCKFSWGIEECTVIEENDRGYVIEDTQSDLRCVGVDWSQIDSEKEYGYFSSKEHAKNIFQKYYDVAQACKDNDCIPPGIPEMISDELQSVLEKN